jgi:hypothetical protein
MRALLLAMLLAAISSSAYAQAPPEPLRSEDFPRNVFPPPPAFNYGLTPEQLSAWTACLLGRESAGTPS